MLWLKIIKWAFNLCQKKYRDIWWANCPFILLKGETTIQSAPTTPAPSVSESAADIYQARLQYDPKVAAMEQQLAGQYYPQQAALQASLYRQYAPQMAQMQEDLRQQFAPTQTALTEAFSQQALQRLQDPYAQTPEETSAMEAIRERQRGGLQEQIRTRANLGGGLYGGRAQAREETAMTELEQAFAAQDIGRRQQGAQTALQYAVPVLQQLYPQTTYPGAPGTQAPVGQSVTPSADTLYNAIFQASQPQYFQSQAPSGTNLGILGQYGTY